MIIYEIIKRKLERKKIVLIFSSIQQTSCFSSSFLVCNIFMRLQLFASAVQISDGCTKICCGDSMQLRQYGHSLNWLDKRKKKYLHINENLVAFQITHTLHFGLVENMINVIHVHILKKYILVHITDHNKHNKYTFSLIVWLYEIMKNANKKKHKKKNIGMLLLQHLFHNYWNHFEQDRSLKERTN